MLPKLEFEETTQSWHLRGPNARVIGEQMLRHLTGEEVTPHRNNMIELLAVTPEYLSHVRQTDVRGIPAVFSPERLTDLGLPHVDDQ